LFHFGKIIEECSRYGDFAHQYEYGFHEVVACGKIDKEPDDDL